jgi:hypothetical protein
MSQSIQIELNDETYEELSKISNLPENIRVQLKIYELRRNIRQTEERLDILKDELETVESQQ